MSYNIAKHDDVTVNDISHKLMWYATMALGIIVCLPPWVRTKNLLTCVCSGAWRCAGLNSVTHGNTKIWEMSHQLYPCLLFLVGLWITGIHGLIQCDIVTRHIAVCDARDTEECGTCGTYLVLETRETLNSVRRMWCTNVWDMSCNGCEIDWFFCIWLYITVS